MRPIFRPQARVKGAVVAPIFMNDPDASLVGLLKQATAFGMGGWWLGGRHMIQNPCAGFRPPRCGAPRGGRLRAGTPPSGGPRRCEVRPAGLRR